MGTRRGHSWCRVHLLPRTRSSPSQRDWSPFRRSALFSLGSSPPASEWDIWSYWPTFGTLSLRRHIWLRAGRKSPMTTLLPILEDDRLLPRPSTPRSARTGVFTKTAAAIFRRIRLWTAFQGRPVSAIAASRLDGQDTIDSWYGVWTASLLRLIFGKFSKI